MFKKKKKDPNATPAVETPVDNKPRKGWVTGLSLAGKIVTAVLVVLVLFWFGFVCQLREGQCGVILRFGAVRKEITQAGVYLKLPWPFESAVTYDSRLQYLESNRLETTTKDKRNVIIQSYIVWEIEDPVLYHNSVGVQNAAGTYINDQVFSATNSTMGAYALSNLVSLDTQQIKVDQIQQEIFQRVQEVCRKNYGILVTDVSILRLSLPETNLNSVFEQMEADRRKEIDLILAEANNEANRISADAAKESAQIIADGITEAAKIKAETETEVAKIYAQAQAENVELYLFLMNLDTLVNSVSSNTNLVISTDEYPFNILTDYAQYMTPEGNDMVVNDLVYILSKLPEKDRNTLIDALGRLLTQYSGRIEAE